MPGGNAVARPEMCRYTVTDPSCPAPSAGATPDRQNSVQRYSGIGTFQTLTYFLAPART